MHDDIVPYRPHPAAVALMALTLLVCLAEGAMLLGGPLWS